MFKVTKQWINANKTPRGSWNYKQLRSIGVEVPPKQGWIDRLDGTEITEEQMILFERHRVKGKKNKSPKEILKQLDLAYRMLEGQEARFSGVKDDLKAVMTRLTNLIMR